MEVPETNLAKELKKYYVKEGREIIFRNGMNLSRVAEEMARRISLSDPLERELVDTSVLSKVIHSNRLLSHLKLDVLCDVIGVNNRQRWELFHTLHLDLSQDENSTLDLSISPKLIDVLLLHLETIIHARKQGKPSIVINIAPVTADMIREITKSSHRSVLHEEAYRLLGQLLSEQVWAHIETSLPDQLFNLTMPLIQEMIEISEDFNDDHLKWWTYFHKGNINYVTKNYDKSITLTKTALAAAPNTDYELMLLRLMALNWAYKKERKMAEEVGVDIRNIIGEGQFTHLESVYLGLEGTGRAHGLTGSLDKAINALDEAQRICKKMEVSGERRPLRYIQNIRSKLIVVQHSDPADKQLIEKLGREGLELAKSYGDEYGRHVRQIENILEKILN